MSISNRTKFFRPILSCSFLAAVLFAGFKGHADDSDVLKSDRQALAEADASGDSSKIMAAKEQLSDDLGRAAEIQRKDMEGVIIPLYPDGQGHLMADVVINNGVHNGVHASLIVDTGSPVIMLSSAFIDRLGLDTSQLKPGYVEVLNGRYMAAAVSLDFVKVGEAQAQDVEATVLMQDNKEIKDGLLGLSFLSKFHFTVDQAGQRLVLRKISNQGTF